MGEHILVIDEGTTSTRAIAYDRAFRETASNAREIELHFPQEGWVEQDGTEIWAASLDTAQQTMDQTGGVDAVAAIGITNQRETTLIWDRETGAPVANAIVWQDRRTAARCDTLVAGGHEARVQAVTGLLVDPYFSATKIAWMLEQGLVERDGAEAGRYAFGTVDSWLVWKLTGGARHVIDVTNASRTLLMDLETGQWSQEMLDLFGVPAALLPEIVASGGTLGESAPELFGKSLPILSAIGDQQAALVGQGCLAPGSAKITYGTGAFLVANTGERCPASRHRLLATKAYDTGTGEAAFALEGSIFNAGTVVKWLRDELGLISEAADTERLAREAQTNGGVYFVPAFTGLGAPHWKAGARGEITGLTRGARAAHIVRAGLEAAAYQTNDLLDAFAADGASVERLRVDGGMVDNDWLMQFLADICQKEVERPAYREMTALGAAGLAAMQLGWTTPQDWAARDPGLVRFAPQMPPAARDALLAGWTRAVAKAAQ
jgi:glycerol kinase